MTKLKNLKIRLKVNQHGKLQSGDL